MWKSVCILNRFIPIVDQTPCYKAGFQSASLIHNFFPVLQWNVRFRLISIKEFDINLNLVKILYLSHGVVLNCPFRWRICLLMDEDVRLTVSDLQLAYQSAIYSPSVHENIFQWYARRWKHKHSSDVLRWSQFTRCAIKCWDVVSYLKVIRFDNMTTLSRRATRLHFSPSGRVLACQQKDCASIKRCFDFSFF